MEIHLNGFHHLASKSTSGNVEHIIIVGRISKMPRFIPFGKRFDTVKTAQLFKNHFHYHNGPPSVTVYEHDRAFISKFWTELLRLLREKLTPSSAYYAQTDGQSEMVNKKVQ